VTLQAILFLTVSLFASAQSSTGEDCQPSNVSREERPKSLDGIFSEVSAESGLLFFHFNGMSGEFYFPEMTGQGGALLDYDDDGDLDVYLVQGSMLGPNKTLEDALFPPLSPLADRLFRSDSALDTNGELVLRFSDVTERSGIEATGYGMGVATGDYNGDGRVDLYVTNYGVNQLFENRGDGTFEDVTARSGTGDSLWGTSASFVDLDGDRLLDLYVVNYVHFDVAENPRCFAASSRRDYCGPDAFRPQPDRLFRNLGNGRFEEVISRVLVGYRPGPGLGVTSADFNGDGLVDLYVANDGKPNQLWINRGDGTFREEALLAGVAVNREGRPEASMGVDAGDFDGDGDEDLYLTHLMGESSTLYVNDGSGLFEDRTRDFGLASVSLPYTSFGTSWIDYDNDGRLDLLALSGAVRILEPQAAAGDLYPLKQPNQLFRNLGVRFEETTARAGESFELHEVSRGAAFGDVDNDGDTDILVLNNNGPARLLINRAGEKANWVEVEPRKALGGAPVTGTRVALSTSGGRRLFRTSATDGSYCSASDPRVVIGAGEGEELQVIEAVWPGGEAVRWLSPPPRRRLAVFPPRVRGSAGK
jgi:hypothetical protein